MCDYKDLMGIGFQGHKRTTADFNVHLRKLFYFFLDSFFFFFGKKVVLRRGQQYMALVTDITLRGNKNILQIKYKIKRVNFTVDNNEIKLLKEWNKILCN